MNETNTKKLKRIKRLLDRRGYFYTEYANGQLQIACVNFWCTTEKWYDTVSKKSGRGFNSYLRHLETNVL